jgi:hypothetical protein
MRKVVISERFGGFGLSGAAIERLRAAGYTDNDRDIERDDPRLVQVVEDMGGEASSGYANLVVVEIPRNVGWHVHEYDGYETIHEAHRSWGSEGETSC